MESTKKPGSRVTIVLSAENKEFLHERQSKEIRDSTASVSFSKILNDAVDLVRTRKC